MEVLVEGLDRQGRRSSGRSRCSRVVNLGQAEGEPPDSAGDLRERAHREGLPELALRETSGRRGLHGRRGNECRAHEPDLRLIGSLEKRFIRMVNI